MFLLDTNVISELRRAKPHGGVLAWFDGLRPDEISIPAVVIGEIARGIELTRRGDAVYADYLSEWLDKISSQFPILPATGPIYRIWGRLVSDKRPDLSNDALIAATAIHHQLTVVTRNVKDFTPFGVLVANPFGRAR
ncbi:Toxin FitB [Alphaproteobacteria bacterium SO-S41]|nr:Toxin FitB [Alphaproteobacteria bacterium SO-S41]